MKKILLASTILAGTAGFAAADNANFTFSGAAYTGLAFSMGWDEPAGVDYDGDGVLGEADVTIFTPEVSAEFTVGMMTTTDGGLEAGANITINAANATMEDDHTEGNFGTNELTNSVDADGDIGDFGNIEGAEVYLSGEWGKVTVAFDGSRNQVTALPFAGVVNNLAGDVDFTYDYSFGDFDVSVWYEYRFGVDNDEYGVEGTYSFADYSIWAGFEYQQDLGVSGGYDAWVGASASMNGFSGEVEVNYEDVSDDFDWYAKVGYGMDAWSVGAFVEDDGVDDDLDFGVNAGYDLGGGVSVDAAYIYDNDTDVSVAKVGVSMKF